MLVAAWGRERLLHGRLVLIEAVMAPVHDLYAWRAEHACSCCVLTIGIGHLSVLLRSAI